MTIDFNKNDEHLPTVAQTKIPTNLHTANIIFTNIILMADKHIIPTGLNAQQLPALTRPYSM